MNKYMKTLFRLTRILKNKQLAKSYLLPGFGIVAYIAILAEGEFCWGFPRWVEHWPVKSINVFGNEKKTATSRL